MLSEKLSITEFIQVTNKEKALDNYELCVLILKELEEVLNKRNDMELDVQEVQEEVSKETNLIRLEVLDDSSYNSDVKRKAAISDLCFKSEMLTTLKSKYKELTSLSNKLNSYKDLLLRYYDLTPKTT